MSIRDKLRGDMLSQMRRYPQRGWIAGVCAGVCEYFDWNVKLVRLLLIVALLCTHVFPLAIAYMVLWYLIDPADASTDASTAPPPLSGAGPSTADPGAPRPGATLRSGDLKARFARLERRLSSMEECVVSKDFELRQELRKLES